MSTETVRVDWIDGQVFLMRDRFEFPIIMTQPMGVNGADLLPLSLIGCSAWDIIRILRKQRQDVTKLEAFADSERDDEPPWRFRRIHVRYRLTGHNLNAHHVQRAIELSETKYCSIYATLRDAVELTSEYEIVDEGPIPDWGSPPIDCQQASREGNRGRRAAGRSSACADEDAPRVGEG